ncbi:transposon Ty3-G Gag-Pol polyprotein [Trichonephila clavipes]|nr:transposon Ty3-G Gag-Pol polyprotein [Trichonephila clavipes]
MLTLRYFPMSWKTAVVIPILKQTQRHLERENILILEQYGFRPRLSTSHQLLRVVEFIKEGKQQDECTAAVFLDIQKAFDRPLDKLAIIADKVSEVVGSSSTICAATTVPPPSQSSSCSAQPTMDSLARQIQELSLQVAELTRKRNSSRHQRYSSDRRRSHSRSRVSIEEVASATIIAVIRAGPQNCVSPCAFVQKKRPSILTVDANISFKNILSEYQTSATLLPISKSASHGTVHHIILLAHQSLPGLKATPKLYDAVKVEFEFLLAQGIIRPSKSPWSSPLHVVPPNLTLQLSSYGLKLNISKCVFGVTELIFLGHFITPDGIKPLPNKVQAVLDYKQPETVGSLRKFLGLLNFYRRFLPKAAEQQYLLSEFLKGSKRKLTSSEKSYSAYDRELLAIYSAIRHFRYMLEARDFTVFTDHKPLTYAFRQK